MGLHAEEPKRMVVPPAEPGATADSGAPETGSARKLLLDEMLAERERAPLPPAPVLTLQPAPVDAAPVGAGRKGALKRLAEVEALARNNLRAAEEARRVMEEERRLLEEEASARTKAERTASALRREIERLRSTEEQRAAQARFAATHQARSELATEIERVHDEHTRVVDELDRMRGTLFDHDSLLDEYSQRLHDEQEAQAKARAELVRAEEAQSVAERNLEIATETARRRAEDDHARLVKVEEELRDTIVERDRLMAELASMTTGDGELARLRRQAESTHEDMTRLLSDLDVQAARADQAEGELAATREARSQAERVAAEAVEARDLAGIALETTRSELAERNEALDAERTTAQAHVADLSAQLATTTRTAESATERVSDLEARLNAAIAERELTATAAEGLTEQLERAVADADQLRTQAASIGDELASTHLALQEVRFELEEVRSELAEARRPVEPPPAEGLAAADPITVIEAPEPAPIDPAIASAFGETIELHRNADVSRDSPRIAGAAPTSRKFRTVDSLPERKRAGGPEVEREAALVREILPADPEPAASDADETDPDTQSRAEPPARRRTAMAELTALALDDITPRRRR